MLAWIFSSFVLSRMLTNVKACRPRNRGDYGLGLPASLTVLLKNSVPQGNRDSQRVASLDRDSQQLGLMF